MEKPIFCFTDKPISNELFDILQRLMQNKDVPIEEIESTPEFEMGRSMCETGEETINKPNRELIRQEIIEKMLSYGSFTTKNKTPSFEGEVIKGRKLDIVIGLPASGKSSAVVEAISQARGAKVIDNDEVKKQIKEFNNGWGANLVHRESKLLNAVIFEEALKAGDNIVLPKVGGYELDIRNLIDEARKYGYSVNLHYVELNRNLAMLRLLTRFIKDGRFLPPNLIYQDDNEIVGNTIRQTYENIVRDGYVDGHSYWDNDVERKKPPKLLDSSKIPDTIILEILMQHTELQSMDFTPYTQKEKIQNIVSGEMVLSKKIFSKLKDKNFIHKIDFENPEKMYLLLKSIELDLYKKGFEGLSTEELHSKLNDFRDYKLENNKSNLKESPVLDELLRQLSEEKSEKIVPVSDHIYNEPIF